MANKRSNRTRRVILLMTAAEAECLERMAAADRRPAAAYARLMLVDAMIAAGELAGSPMQESA